MMMKAWDESKNEAVLHACSASSVHTEKACVGCMQQNRGQVVCSSGSSKILLNTEAGDGVEQRHEQDDAEDE